MTAFIEGMLKAFITQLMSLLGGFLDELLGITKPAA